MERIQIIIEYTLSRFRKNVTANYFMNHYNTSVIKTYTIILPEILLQDVTCT